ncbi:LamG-like jellyroll fold domain-containing protein [Phragmitibacter flavus]|nr:LamG-like jellyroll fold domain-containing protein [Phragmitibacter flavus]
MNLTTLIHARLDGEITPEQLQQLENHLRNDWQARRHYLELADQHARLLQQPAINTGRLQEQRNSETPIRAPRWRPATTLSLIALAATIAFGIYLFQPPPSNLEPTSNGVAILSQTLDAEFAKDTTLSRSDTLSPGIIRIDQGLAQIEFFSGATALIEGSAEIEIISAWEARCLRGRVRVHVPPAAKGFLMHAPDMKLEDLGTEFALNVQDQTSAVHVFDGEVIAHTPRQKPASLTRGMTFSPATTSSTSQDFLPISQIQDLVQQRQNQRFESWKSSSQQSRHDPRLIALYLFNQESADPWDRLINNLTLPPQDQRAGGAVGARWTQGRWPQKQALEFKRPGDRVRINLDGTYNALTFSCWIKVDSVDKKYNSLLLTDGYENGEPHWQIFEDGSLMFSIKHQPDHVPPSTKYNQIYYSPPVFHSDTLGRWHHIAVTYNNTDGTVIQYFDGKPVSRAISPLHQPGRPITYGPCEIGNWGLPTSPSNFPIRNLNGSIDEFAIYHTALTPAEISTIFTTGSPQ